MGKIDLAKAPVTVGSGYPAPFHVPCMARERRQLSDLAGLTQFGVNTLRLQPGAWSSQRHWHQHQDEFVYVLEGEVTLVTDTGEAVLRVGDCAGFAAGTPDGHHLKNHAASAALLLVVGTRTGHEFAVYSDIDMTVTDTQSTHTTVFAHKDGTPYPPR